MEVSQTYIRTLEASMLAQVLAEYGISEKIRTKLVEEDLNGQMLFDLSEEDLIECNFKKAHAKHIKTVIAKFPVSSVEEVRPFRQPVEKDTKYVFGRIHRLESTANSQTDRIFEHKELSTFDEDAFVKRVRTFTVACINSRQNGTICFGVADNKRGSIYKHGQIVGVSSISSLDDIPEILSKHFLNENPVQLYGASGELKVAMRSCLFYPGPIKVENTPDSRFIIEIDVEPKHDNCTSDLVMYSKTREGKRDAKMYWHRIGTSSQSAALDKEGKFSEKEFKKFCHTVERNHETRRKAERTQYGHFPTQECESQMKQMICRGFDNIKEDEFIYVLFIDSLYSDASMFQWVNRISFEFVFDMSSSDVNYNGMVHKIRKSEELNKFSLQEIETMMQSHLKTRDQIDAIRRSAPQQWIHLSKNDPTDYDTWIGESKAPASQALNLLLSEKSLVHRDQVIAIMVLNDQDTQKVTASLYLELRSILKDNQIVLLSQQQEVFHNFADNTHFARNKLQPWAVSRVSWDYLDTFMTSHTSRSSDESGKIPCTLGDTGIEVEDAELRKLTSLNILCCNQDVLFKKDKRNGKKEEATKHLTEFFEGKIPDWRHLYFSFDTSLFPGAIERPHVASIINDINVLCSSDQEISTFYVLHEPSSGASTSAKTVLWKQKLEKRCCFVDCQVILHPNREIKKERIKKIADQLARFHDLKENSKETQRGRSVSLMLDNVTLELLEEIKRELRNVFEKCRQSGGFTFRQTIILAVVRSQNVNIEAQNLMDIHIGSSTTFKYLKLKQEFSSEEEQKLFNDRSEDLKKEPDLVFDTLFSFVVLAGGMNKDSKFVSKYIDEALNGLDKIEEYRTEQKNLLLYLSMMRCYLNEKGQWKGLPTQHCIYICTGERAVYGKSRILPICKQVELCTLQEQLFDSNQERSYILRLKHIFLAERILEKFSSTDDPATIMMNFLKEPVLQYEDTLKTRLHSYLQQILTSRKHKFTDYAEMKKDNFSPFITELETSSKAAKILMQAHEVIDTPNNYMLAQTLARWYQFNNEFQDAIKWIDKALESIDSNDEREPFYLLDTKGQIFKQEFMENGDLSHARAADYYYKRAQDSYENFAYKRDDEAAASLMGRIRIRIGVGKVLQKQCQSYYRVKFERDLAKTLKEEDPDISHLERKMMPEDYTALTVVWNENKVMVENLYVDLCGMIAVAARCFRTVRVEQIEGIISDFNSIFQQKALSSSAVENLMQQKRGINDEQKIATLVSYLDPIFLRDFSGALDRNEDLLNLFSNALKNCQVYLNEGRCNKKQAFKIRLCYVTVFLVLRKKNLTNYLSRLDLEFAEKCCDKLQDEETGEKGTKRRRMDIHLLYVLLGLGRKSNGDTFKKRFMESFKFLAEDYRDYLTSKQTQKECELFFIVKRDTFALSEQDEVNPAWYFVGRLKTDKTIYFQLPDFEDFPALSLGMHPSWSHQTSSGIVKDVKFTISFSVNGVLAKEYGHCTTPVRKNK